MLHYTSNVTFRNIVITLSLKLNFAFFLSNVPIFLQMVHFYKNATFYLQCDIIVTTFHKIVITLSIKIKFCQIFRFSGKWCIFLWKFYIFCQMLHIFSKFYVFLVKYFIFVRMLKYYNFFLKMLNNIALHWKM